MHTNINMHFNLFICVFVCIRDLVKAFPVTEILLCAAMYASVFNAGKILRIRPVHSTGDFQFKSTCAHINYLNLVL